MLSPVILIRVFPINTANFKIRLICYKKVSETKNRPYFFVKSSFSFCLLSSSKNETCAVAFYFITTIFQF